MKNTFKIVAFLLALAFVLPNAAFADEARDKKNKIINDFERITVPSILAMAPHILKTPAERKAAHNNIDPKLKGGECASAAYDAIVGNEAVPRDAGNLCLAMKNWLSGKEIRTCSNLEPLEGREFLVGETDRRITRKLEQANIMQIYNNLHTVSGCKDKDEAYWARRTVSQYTEMYKLMDATPKENYDTIRQKIEDFHNDCYALKSLYGNYSIVAETASSGCDAVQSIVRNQDACFSIFNARWNGVRAAVNDPLKDDLLYLRVTYQQLTQKTGCEAKVQEHFAKWGTPKQEVILDPRIQSQIDTLLIGFNGSMRSAASNLERVETWRQYSVRSYKPGETNGEHENARLNAIRSMCNYKTYTRTDLYTAQVAARDIYALSATEVNKNRFDNLKHRMREINDDIKRTCE